MKGIIIDGIVATGKTTVLALLHQKIIQKHPSSTTLFITEHYTQRSLEHLVEANTITGANVRDHINSIIQIFETIERIHLTSNFAGTPQSAEAFVILERFIMTLFITTSHLTDAYTIEDAKKDFFRLKNLHLKQYLLILSESQLHKNITSSLKYRNKVWKLYIMKKGGIQKVVYEYIQQQQLLLTFVEQIQDSIDIEIINSVEGKYEKYANEIYLSAFDR